MSDIDDSRAQPDDSGDEQAIAEAMDDDKVLGMDMATDAPRGAEEFGTTPIEESGGESVEERDRRYERDGDLREPGRPLAGLMEPDDEFGDDETKELVAEQGDEPEFLSAEEAAIHERRPLTDDPEEEPLVDLREHPGEEHIGHGGLDDAATRDTAG